MHVVSGPNEELLLLLLVHIGRIPGAAVLLLLQLHVSIFVLSMR